MFAAVFALLAMMACVLVWCIPVRPWRRPMTYSYHGQDPVPMDVDEEPNARPQRHNLHAPDVLQTDYEMHDVSSPRVRSHRPVKPILFYHRDQPCYEFTNFSPHPVEFAGKVYPTAEHLFQAHKFLDTDPALAERIRRLPSARAALEEAARSRRLQRPDWFDVNVGIMDMILEAKFTQHSRLRRILLDTGESQLIEDSPVDSFWGVGRDGQGRNELGKALMRVRGKLNKSRL